MSKPVVISPPVVNLPKSMAFFKALGFSHNPRFTGDTAALSVITHAVRRIFKS